MVPAGATRRKLMSPQAQHRLLLRRNLVTVIIKIKVIIKRR